MSSAHMMVSPPGSGQPVEAFGTYLIRMTAAETEGRLGMFDVTVEPGGGAPPHIHAREDEFIRVLSGTIRFSCADERVDLSEGGCILLPRGVPHGFENTGPGVARATVIVMPGGFEAFFPAIAERGAADPDAIAAVAAGFGLSFV